MVALLAGEAGIEPANLRLTVGYITALSLAIKRVLSRHDLRAEAQIELVEEAGVDPAGASLQNSPAPRCFPRIGAERVS